MYERKRPHSSGKVVMDMVGDKGRKLQKGEQTGAEG